MRKSFSAFTLYAFPFKAVELNKQISSYMLCCLCVCVCVSLKQKAKKQAKTKEEKSLNDRRRQIVWMLKTHSNSDSKQKKTMKE